ncbi:MAG: ATP-binding cassette domain-containing protein, partial [Ruminiclostridium sp.]|nr:ATP-binding cassette domain-containing protein [Ruminiclostridium sp.]
YRNSVAAGVMALALGIGMSSCKEKEFKINGTIEGGSDRSVVLEKASFAGNWIPVDSARVNDKGGFEIASARPSAPEIYRLALGDRYIYLPVDSTETLTVISKASDFGTEFSVSGSAQAEKFALADIDLHIKSGETIGIIGGTGSSKSSLIQLISRLYDATEGNVMVGGVDVKDYDVEVLRNQVAVVLQKNVLFSGTIKENLRWGNKEATDEEMIEACKISQADEFIQGFPDGYDTYIEQGGANVSGGQKQRLCIARALLKKPKILILDDSTSAVDTKTDALIRHGFKKYMPNTTKIIIAQRTSSIQDADRIIVMDGGKINGMGTHEELLKTNAIYREVYTSQNKANDDQSNESEVN